MKTIKNILVVDDSATERHAISEILGKAGFSVTLAESAEDASNKIRAKRPDLILMDVIMPGQNGYQATRDLSRDPDTAAIPVIMCTSKGNPTDVVWGRRQGAKEYVVKPVRADELLAKISAVAAAA